MTYKNNPFVTLLALLALSSIVHSAGYSVSYGTLNALGTSTSTSLSATGAYTTNFFAFSGWAHDGATTPTNTIANVVVDRSFEVQTTNGGSRYLNTSVIGHNTAAIGTITYNTCSAGCNTAVAGISANVIYTSNTVNGNVYYMSGATASSTTYSLSYTVASANSFVVILYSIGGKTWSSAPTTSAAGCSLAQDAKQGTFAEASVMACNSVGAGTYTANAVTQSGTAHGSYAIAAYVFPPYAVTLDESPAGGGNTLTQGVQYQNGNAILVIGTNTIQAVPKTGYAFTSWSGATGNVIIANALGATSAITVEGAGTVTANYGSTLSGITLVPSNTVLDGGQTEVFTGNLIGGVSPYTYNYFNGTGSSTLAKYTGVAGTSNQVAFTVNSATQNHQFTYNLIVTDGFPFTLNSISNTIVVNTQLTASAAPSASAQYLDVDQAETVTGTIPSSGTSPFTYNWLISDNGGAYSQATQCAANSGTGQASGNTVTCSVPASTFLAANTYSFKLQVTDSASTPSTVTSGASTAISVAAKLTAPNTPSISAALLDSNQAETVNGVIPSTGTSPFTYNWLISRNGGAYVQATQCAVNSGTGQASGNTVTCSVPASTFVSGNTYSLELKAADSANSPEVATSSASSNIVASSPITAPGAPTVSAQYIDADQSETFTGTIPSSGTSPFTYNWLISDNGGSYAQATQCAANSGTGQASGNTVACVTSGGAFTAGHTYSAELKVSDGATTPETATSGASGNVAVTSQLTAPSAPTVSAPKLDSNQPETVNDVIPSAGRSPFTYNWLISDNGGSYAQATQCAANSGTGQASGNTVTCSVPASTFVTGNTYSFELKVTDSATSPETATSSASPNAIVSSQVTAPGAPTVSAQYIDADQSETFTGTIPSSGTSPFTYNWLISDNGGSYAQATQCAANSGTGQASGNTVACVTSGGAFTAGHTYSAELKVSDGATTPETATSGASGNVAVTSQLTAPSAPTLSAQYVDADQAESVSGVIPSTGKSPFTYNWLISDNGGSYAQATQCAANSGTGQASGNTVTCAIAGNALSAGHTYAAELKVSDSATSPESATSSSSTNIVVATQLAAPAAPTVSLALIDSDQAESVSGTIPSSGTSPFTYDWLISDDGGAYSAATQCAVDSGSGQAGGNTVSCNVPANTLSAGHGYSFKIKVTDGATAGESATSASSGSAAVSTAFTAPAAPTLSSNAIDSNQQVTATGTIPYTGTPPYDYDWLVSLDGNPYVVTTRCLVNSGTGQAANAVENCVVPANTLAAGDTYVFKLEAKDGASMTEVNTSAGSATLTVSQIATPSMPLVSDPKLDLDEKLTVTGETPANGLSPFTYNWLISVNGGAYSETTQCAANSGTGQAYNTQENCVIAGNTFTIGDTYSFELQITDAASATSNSIPSNTVAVASQLTAPGNPSVSAPLLDNDQTETITGTIPSTGTPPYSYDWLRSLDGGSYALSTRCDQNTGSGQIGGNVVTCVIEPSNALPAGQVPNFELQVRDAASTPEGAVSAASVNIMVSLPIDSPGTPTVSSQYLDVNQSETFTSTLPSTGTSPFTYDWLISDDGGAYSAATQCAVDSGSGQASGNTVTCAIAGNALSAGHTYAAELEATDSATVQESSTSAASENAAVASQLAAPGAPTVSAQYVDADQAETVNGIIPSTGTPSYSYAWLVSDNGGAYSAATQCAANSGSGQLAGNTVSCGIEVDTLQPGDTYAFELRASDSATFSETATSSASPIIHVASELAAPATPAVSAQYIDVNQAESVTGTIPSTGTSPFTYNWLISDNGGAYSAATQCAVDSGTGQASGNTVMCGVSGNSLTTGHTYSFKLGITDSAATQESATSAASGNVMVESQLAAPSAPTVSAQYIDSDQAETVNGVVPSTGTSPYSYTWLTSTNGGAYSAATQCAVDSGSGQAPSNAVTCSIAANALASGDTYVFELQTADSASVPSTSTSSASLTVHVGAKLTSPNAPSVTAQYIDVNQAESVTGTIPSTGTSPFTYNWLVSEDGGAYAQATQCAANSGTGQASGNAVTCAIAGNALTAGHTYSFELKVTDDAATQESATSGASSNVIVASQLAAPGAPTATALYIDLDQSETVNDIIPSTGTSPYSYTWLTSTNGGAYSAATQCAVDSGSGQAPSNAVTCSIAANALASGDTYAFELQVSDGASAPATVTSSASPAVHVASKLTAPNAPSVSAQYIDVNQAETAAGAIPSTGTSPFTYNWLVSEDGGAYAQATQCAANSGTGQAPGNAVSCAIGGNSLFAGHSYAFELTAMDGANSVESSTSAPSANIMVSSQLTAPSAPSISAQYIDHDQSETVSSVMPSTGTSPYSYDWLVSVNGGSYSATTQCAANSGTGQASGNTVACGISGNTLSSGNRYSFELQVSDGASVPSTVISAASTTVDVGAALSAPAAPSVSAQDLDVDQAETVNGVMPSTGTSPFSYSWLVSEDGGAYASAAQCAANSGTGQASGNTVTCAIAGNALEVGHAYLYELQVTDSASLPEFTTSVASPSVSVASQLIAPDAPTFASSPIDSDEPEAVNGTIPTTGTSPYTYNWLVSEDGGAYAQATQCAVDSGTGQTVNSAEQCSVSANTLTGGHNYHFELRISDSASASSSVTSPQSAALGVGTRLLPPAAPALSSNAIDSNQPMTINGIVPYTGTSPYSYDWLVSINGNPYVVTTRCTVNSGTGQAANTLETCFVPGNTLAAGDTYSVELQIKDEASPNDVAVSPPSTFTVSQVATAGMPVVSETKLDVDESLLVTGVIPSNGVPPFTYNWLVSDDGGAYSPATQCSVNSGTGQAANSVENCNIAGNAFSVGSSYAFELQVTDTAAVTTNSAPSNAVTVSTQLAASSTPTVSLPLLDNDQTEAISGTIPSTGTPPYSYVWLRSVNGGPYTPSTRCDQNSGSGVGAGDSVACIIEPSNALPTGQTPNWELQVRDGASTPEGVTSPASANVIVSLPLGAPAAPAVSAPNINASDPETINGIMPSDGTTPFTYNWLVSEDGGAYAQATQCAVNSSTGHYPGDPAECDIAGDTLDAGHSYLFELQVSDSATAPETQAAASANSVTVNSPPHHGHGATTTTTTTTTASTTTAFTTSPNSTTLQLVVTVDNGTVIVRNYTSNTPVSVTLQNPRISLGIYVSQSTYVSVANVTGSGSLPPLPAGYLKLLAYSIGLTSSGSGANPRVNATLGYACGLPAQEIRPFILADGVWEPITPFHVNPSECTVSFQFDADPVVALGEYAAASTTTVATTTVPFATTTATPGATTTIPQGTPQPVPQADYAAAIALIALALLLLLLIKRRKRKSRTPKGRPTS